MKILALIFLITFFTTITNAQITKGNWMVGGDASFSTSDTYSNIGDETKIVERAVNISPNIGYFAIDKLATGIRLDYRGVFNPNYGFGDISTNSIGLGPFVRYYFLKPEKRVNIFLEMSYGFGKTFYNGSIISADYVTKNTTFTIMGGPVIYFNSSVSMELSVQYSSTRKIFEVQDLTNNVFQIGLGFQIYLEKNN